MRERLRIFVSLIVFWMCFMIVARIVFLIYNAHLTADLSTIEIFQALLYGLRMDASITGYFMAASGIVLIASAFGNPEPSMRILLWLTSILIAFASLVVVVDVELYRHWGFRMNTTPLMYIGGEAMSSIPSVVYMKLSLIFIILFLASVSIIRKAIFPVMKRVQPAISSWRVGTTMLLLTALMFLPIRGSFTVAPMNTGFVYFHNTKAYANHSAVNVIWNFLYSVQKGSSNEYPENFFDRTETATLFNDLYKTTNNVKVVSSPSPNIILIIIESFTADVIESLGGVPGVAPNIDSLCHQGILFSNIYSSGDRTDKGLISILSGFPAQPQGSVIKFPAKTERLPQLNRKLRALGYNTSFLYGGDIDFANFRSYLNSSGFDHLTDLDDFPSEQYTSKWGVHDHLMFEQAMYELDTTRGKFFKVILTLSSHEPFDVPLDPPFRTGTDEESLFLNSCHYTDKTIGTFIQYCRIQPWWDNTMVVITADHGHRHPRNKELIQKERFHIPLLLTGGAITRDTVVTTIGSQTDIANTILSQLDSRDTTFIFSRDLLSADAKSFAAYYFTDGFGFVLPHTHIVYDNTGKQFLKQDGATPHDISLGKAHQQMLYSTYNKLDK